MEQEEGLPSDQNATYSEENILQHHSTWKVGH